MITIPKKVPVNALLVWGLISKGYFFPGITTIAGGKKGRGSGHVDGPSEDAKFSNDFDVVYVGSSCSLLVIDRGNQAIREIQLHFDDCAYQYGSGFPLGRKEWAIIFFFLFFKIIYVVIEKFKRHLKLCCRYCSSCCSWLLRLHVSIVTKTSWDYSIISRCKHQFLSLTNYIRKGDISLIIYTTFVRRIRE